MELSSKILFVTGTDDTFRKPLLETQGYTVRTANIDNALRQLSMEKFKLALITTEHGITRTIVLCEQLKSAQPELRVGVLAQHSDDIPSTCVDIVLRMQYSPAKFLAAIRIVMEG